MQSKKSVKDGFRLPRYNLKKPKFFRLTKEI